MLLSSDDMNFIVQTLTAYKEEVVFSGSKEQIKSEKALIDSVIKKIKLRKYQFDYDEFEIIKSSLDFLVMFTSDALKDFSFDDPLYLESEKMYVKAKRTCNIVKDELRALGEDSL